jgi:hypothetical protein
MIRCFCLILICSFHSLVYGQGKSNLDLLQGFWKKNSENANVKGYEYYEGNSLYSISIINGEFNVLKYYVAFYHDFPEDSIALKDLNEDGSVYGFIDYLTLKDNPVKIESSDFKALSYDLGADYFIYYGNTPNSYSKIKSLPADIYPQFLKKKEELDRRIIFDFVPDYRRKGTNPLPYTIEATKENVYFHSLPESSTKRKAFIVKGQQAKVLEYKNGWYYVVFYGKSSKTTGWVKATEVK